MCHLANAHYMTGPAGILHRMAFYCCLAGPVGAIGKAYVHWVGVLTYKN